MNRLRHFFWTFLILLVLTPFLTAETQLIVLHSNDHHGHIQPTGELGGLSRFASLVKQIRKEAAEEPNTHVILIDAGDVNTGTPESDLFWAKPDFEVYNHLAYDFMAIGNHEFDKPFEKLLTQIRETNFPLGSANVLGANGQPLGTPYKILDFPDCRVGIFGLTVANMTILPKGEGRYSILDEIETARRMVQFLKEEQRVDLVIAVTHIGLVLDVGAKIISSDLAAAVPEIDLIIDGHSHTLMKEPVVVNETPIVSANEWSKYLGEARFTVEKGKIQAFSWRCIPVTSDLPEDPETVAILKPYLDEANRRFQQVIAQTEAELPGNNKICRREETALSDLVADCVIWLAKKDEVPCDFAFINSGNIRASIPAGDVTLADVSSAFPFQNELWVLDLDGKTLLELFQFIARIPVGTAAYPQFSREVKLCVNEKTNEILKLTIQNEAIQPEKIYHVAVPDFLAHGGDGYEVLQKYTGMKVLSKILPVAIAEYLKVLPQPIKVEKDARYQRVESGQL